MVMQWRAEKDPRGLKKRGKLKQIRRIGNGPSEVFDADCDRRKARIEREQLQRDCRSVRPLESLPADREVQL